ncbi:helix-turn-helix domain-containing protein [Pedobacter aquatilis]|uniref:response regulator transcription factor n=1 Tax=Pedobacter aquatilis TaxID=351343 RepID=UPI00292DE219|nr:helix-turn-helix domain-containing protein [Pedobacter aquatilis]
MNEYLKIFDDFPGWFYLHDDIPDYEKIFDSLISFEYRNRLAQHPEKLLPIVYVFDLKKLDFVFRDISRLSLIQWEALRKLESSSISMRMASTRHMDSCFSQVVFFYKTILENPDGLPHMFLHKAGLWGEKGKHPRLCFGILFQKGQTLPMESSISLIKTSFFDKVFHPEKPCLFSPREAEILYYMSEGFSSKQIASILNLSEFTIVNHRKNMLEKSGKPNATSLVSHAIREKII